MKRKTEEKKKKQRIFGAQNHIKNTWHKYKRMNVSVYYTFSERECSSELQTRHLLISFSFCSLSSIAQHKPYHVCSMDDITAPKTLYNINPILLCVAVSILIRIATATYDVLLGEMTKVLKRLLQLLSAM